MAAKSGKIKELWVEISGDSQKLAKELSAVNTLTKRHAFIWRNDMEAAFAKPLNLKSLKDIDAELKTLSKQADATRQRLVNAIPHSPEAVKAATELKVIEQRMTLLGTAADRARTRLETFKSGLTSVSTATMAFTASLVAGAGALMKMASDSAKYCEDLTHMQATTGMTTDYLQRLRYVSKSIGQDFDTVANASAMVQQKLFSVGEDSGNAAKVLHDLGIEAKDSSGQFRAMSQIFPEIITKLQGLSNDTQRNVYASQLFGKSWRELGPIIHMTATVITPAQIEQGAEFSRQMNELEMQLKGVAIAAGTELMPVLKDQVFPIIRDSIPVIKSMVQAGAGLLRWFLDLGPAAKWTIGIILGIGMAVGPIMKVIGAVNALKSTYALLTLAEAANTTAKVADAAATVVDTTAESANVVALGAEATAAGVATASFWALAAAKLAAAGPVGAVIAAGAIAGYAVYKDVDAAIETHNDYKEAAERDKETAAMQKGHMDPKAFAKKAADDTAKARAAGYHDTNDLRQHAADGDVKAAALAQQLGLGSRLPAKTPPPPPPVAAPSDSPANSSVTNTSLIDAWKEQQSSAQKQSMLSNTLANLNGSRVGMTDKEEEFHVHEQIRLKQEELAKEQEISATRLKYIGLIAAATDDKKAGLQAQMDVELSGIEATHQIAMENITAEEEAHKRKIEQMKAGYESLKASIMGILNFWSFKDPKYNSALETGWNLAQSQAGGKLNLAEAFKGMATAHMPDQPLTHTLAIKVTFDQASGNFNAAVDNRMVQQFRAGKLALQVRR